MVLHLSEVNLTKSTISDTLIITNGFIHDLATGTWLGSLLLMYLTTKLAAKQLPDANVELMVSEMLAYLWALALICLGLMMLTGIGRAYSLKRYGWTGDIAQSRKKLLLIKHVLLGIMVCGGLIFQVKVYFGW